MVTEFSDKRRQDAIVSDVSLRTIPVAEIGVCLGHSREAPGAYDFVLSNGRICPRRVVELVQVHPFDWKRKTVLRGELRLPSVGVPVFS